MSRSNELRVFISSTFRDLQEEREYLVKKVFPEIRSLCRERGVTFTDIDLRWGLTEEQVRRVTGDPKASSPLYLRVVSEELRLHGEHETLDEEINRYTQVDDLLGVFEVLLARIEAAEGNVEGAVEQLGAMLSEASEEEQRAELQYWLWKLVGREADRGEALRLYAALFETAPRSEYKQRMEELMTSTLPTESTE